MFGISSSWKLKRWCSKRNKGGRKLKITIERVASSQGTAERIMARSVNSPLYPNIYPAELMTSIPPERKFSDA